jgi:hypothetical protein
MVRLAGPVSYGTKGNVQVELSVGTTLLSPCKEMLNARAGGGPRKGSEPSP